MSNLSWYWHRLRAMSPAEMALHARKKLRQLADARRLPDWGTLSLEASGGFPVPPRPDKAPVELQEALRRDSDNIVAGRWKAFGHLDLNVDDPPKWHCDYLVGKDLATTESAFKLDHRALPDGADIKLIWELSRWHPLVRLAMAAYVLGDERAAGKCVLWLEDWVKHNPPYRGWNWTSALEAGMRLIQFTWIDALLGAPSSRSARIDVTHAPSGSSALQSRLAALRQAILPPHLSFAWRHRSFGSSANNHLLGELTGCIVATVRWPALAKWSASLDVLQRLWEREVLAQFAEDGGNKEQALNYQLFSWELCWQARLALLASGRAVSQSVEDRLNHAAGFEVDVRSETETWDYGDSDNAYVTPFFLGEATMTSEWHKWMENKIGSPAFDYWLAKPPRAQINAELVDGTPSERCFPCAGIANYRGFFWTLRWDLSPLGYLGTAAHGHLDALHLSIWFKNVAFIVDPGTGAYYAEPGLRTWLASRAAHNAPCPAGNEQPSRLGPFLWAENHRPPAVSHEGRMTIGVLSLIGQQLRRAIAPLPHGSGWSVKDECLGKDGRLMDFTVRWQFAPETCVKRLDARRFLLKRHEVQIEIQVSEGWSEAVLVEMDGLPHTSLAAAKVSADFEGIVSPAFRRTARAPFLKLIAKPGAQAGGFTTTFLG